MEDTLDAHLPQPAGGAATLIEALMVKPLTLIASDPDVGRGMDAVEFGRLFVSVQQGVLATWLEPGSADHAPFATTGGLRLLKTATDRIITPGRRRLSNEPPPGETVYKRQRQE